MKHFLSYSRSDQAFALRLAHDLQAVGGDIWVDQTDIAVGENWDRAVEAAVRGCEGFIVILSPRSIVSEHVADEVNVAFDGAKMIIPILYETCTVPMRLSRLQFIDTRSDYQAALERCARLVVGNEAGDLERSARATTSSTPPEGSRTLDGWSDQTLDDAERELVSFVGPVARLLVRNAAVDACNESELYQALAVAIPREDERQQFLHRGRTAPEESASVRATERGPSEVRADILPAESIDELCHILTGYLGPIARHVLLDEASAASSRNDLWRRLAARISSDEERDELLREISKFADPAIR